MVSEPITSAAPSSQPTKPTLEQIQARFAVRFRVWRLAPGTHGVADAFKDAREIGTVELPPGSDLEAAGEKIAGAGCQRVAINRWHSPARGCDLIVEEVRLTAGRLLIQLDAIVQKLPRYRRCLRDEQQRLSAVWAELLRDWSRLHFARGLRVGDVERAETPGEADVILTEEIVAGAREICERAVHYSAERFAQRIRSIQQYRDTIAIGEMELERRAE